MVVKRTCSFCAGEIEPGTGTMYIKRDGAVFHFCSSSCRKQQLHLGRVGHRLKWTRAHALRRQTEQSSAIGKAAAAAKSKPSAPAKGSPTPKSPPSASAVDVAAPAAAEASVAEPSADEPRAKTSGSESSGGPPKKPRAKKARTPGGPG